MERSSHKTQDPRYFVTQRCGASLHRQSPRCSTSVMTNAVLIPRTSRTRPPKQNARYSEKVEVSAGVSYARSKRILADLSARHGKYLEYSQIVLTRLTLSLSPPSDSEHPLIFAMYRFILSESMARANPAPTGKVCKGFGEIFS